MKNEIDQGLYQNASDCSLKESRRSWTKSIIVLITTALYTVHSACKRFILEALPHRFFFQVFVPATLHTQNTDNAEAWRNNEWAIMQFLMLHKHGWTVCICRVCIDDVSKPRSVYLTFNGGGGRE